MIDESDLTKTNLFRIKRSHYEVAVIPTCAIEPHNLHLPFGQDYLQTAIIAHRCCRAAWEKCHTVVCLPAIPYGVDCNLMDFPMTIHVSQHNLDAILRDVIISVRKHGIRKVVILNGHGGNDFVPFIRQIQCDVDTHVFLCNFWQVCPDKYDEIFQTSDDHAGEFETSCALHLFPELVEMANARDGKPKPFRFEALEKGWFKTSRTFSKMNDFCACGSPAAASAEKGKKFLDLVCERITNFLIQLAQEPIDENFPHTQ